MLNRLPEIEIPENNPFENDKLNRKVCADTFCSILKMYSETGCVIALNGEWGTGKTTFVRMLMQKMKNDGAHPIYFNAWENDNVADPLIALLAEMKSLSTDTSKWNKVVENGGKIIAGITTSAIKGFIKNKLGIDSDTLTKGVNEIDKILKSDIEGYSKQKATFDDFRKSLQTYIADNSGEGLPVVFFIDELDRCNPQFSVLVLERIKHLFDIPNIIFVLSINKKQLGYAIQGYYGSSYIDADNYLRRFIDIEYSLPQPSTDIFCQYLYDVYHFEDVFEKKERYKISEFRADGDNFKAVAKNLISFSGLDIRTIDKIFAHTRLALMGFADNNYIIPDVFFMLCFLRIANTNLYHNILEKKYSPQELVNLFETYLPKDLLTANDYSNAWRQMVYTIALFVYMYNLDDYSGRERSSLIANNDSKTSLLLTKCLDSKVFGDALVWYHEKHNFEVPLMHLIKRIELQMVVSK